MDATDIDLVLAEGIKRPPTPQIAASPAERPAIGESGGSWPEGGDSVLPPAKPSRRVPWIVAGVLTGLALTAVLVVSQRPWPGQGPPAKAIEIPAMNTAASTVTPRRPAPNPSPAGRLADEGKTALHQGRLDVAQEKLEACLVQDPNSATCHRSLGVLFAQRLNTSKSLDHYRRYVELAPAAPDADRVRQILQTADRRAAGKDDKRP